MKRQQRRQIERLLPKLTSSEDLSRMFREFDPRVRESLELAVLHYDEQMESARNQDQASVARTMHEAMDRALDNLKAHHPLAGEVKCREGCNHCCHMHVGVSLPEARLMLTQAKKQGVKIDNDRLQRQKGRGLEGWSDLSPPDRACAFLMNGACSIYESRPGACRKLLVISPPEQCDVITNPDSPATHLSSPEAEVVYSVLLTRQGYGSLPDMIVKAMKES